MSHSTNVLVHATTRCATRIAVGVLAALVVLLPFSSCSSGNTKVPTLTTTTTTSSTTTTSTTTTAPPTTAPPPTTAAASSVDGLSVAPPGSGAGYNRDLFVQWTDANHDGCDTRCEVLKRQHQPALPGLPNGGWLSPYDGYTTSDPSELDIDHVVPLHEAWLSGAVKLEWSDSDRVRERSRLARTARSHSRGEQVEGRQGSRRVAASGSRRLVHVCAGMGGRESEMASHSRPIRGRRVTEHAQRLPDMRLRVGARLGGKQRVGPAG